MGRLNLTEKSSEIPLGRVPPSNQEAEQSVLGGILLEGRGLDQVADLLKPEDFYFEAHGRIYQAMLGLYQKREPVDLSTVATRLLDQGILEQVGGLVFLAELSEHVGTAANIEYYARIVSNKAILRRLIRAAGEIAARCYQPLEDAEECLDWAENHVFEIATSKQRTDLYAIGTLVENEIALLEAIHSKEKGRITGIPSGFTDLDKMTAGFQPSDLIILAARPSMGKTALALNMAYNAAGKKCPVAIFSLEMSKEQLVRRLLSAIGQVDAANLRNAFLGDKEWVALQEAAGRLFECPIVIDDTPAASVLEVRAKCRRLKAQDKLGLVILDYLQLMRGRHDVNSREQEISEISRSLKAMAKELNVPVIALSQLNREVEKRTNKRPELSDLRESGAIEQDADVILFIYRDEVYNQNSDQKGIAEILLKKQRNGQTGDLKLFFWKEYTLFRDYSGETAAAYG